MTPREKECLPVGGLAAEHLNLVRSIASRIQRSVGFAVELDDLVSVGMLGLLQSAHRYDPGAGTRFSTFAFYRIQGAILDGLGDVLPIPRPRREEEEMPAPAGDPADAGASPDEAVERAADTEIIDRAVARLPARQRRLIESHYFGGATLQEAGRGIGVSKSWASRMHARTLARLRELLEEEGFVWKR